MKKCLFVLIFLSSTITSCFAVTQSQKNTILEQHNSIRTQYNLPSLIWDTKIEKQAQDWANIIAKKNILAHSTPTFRNGMGENIYMITSYGQKIISDGSDAIASWYNEQSEYNYTSNSCKNGSVCGHFTQIVWKSTKRIGCGQSTIKKVKLPLFIGYASMTHLEIMFEKNHISIKKLYSKWNRVFYIKGSYILCSYLYFPNL